MARCEFDVKLDAQYTFDDEGNVITFDNVVTLHSPCEPPTYVSEFQVSENQKPIRTFLCAKCAKREQLNPQPFTTIYPRHKGYNPGTHETSTREAKGERRFGRKAEKIDRKKRVELLSLAADLAFGVDYGRSPSVERDGTRYTHALNHEPQDDSFSLQEIAYAE